MVVSVLMCGPLKHEWVGHQAWRSWDGTYQGRKLVGDEWVPMTPTEAGRLLREHVMSYMDNNEVCPCYAADTVRRDKVYVAAGAWHQVQDKSLIPEEIREGLAMGGEAHPTTASPQD